MLKQDWGLTLCPPSLLQALLLSSARSLAAPPSRPSTRVGISSLLPPHTNLPRFSPLPGPAAPVHPAGWMRAPGKPTKSLGMPLEPRSRPRSALQATVRPAGAGAPELWQAMGQGDLRGHARETTRGGGGFRGWDSLGVRWGRIFHRGRGLGEGRVRSARKDASPSGFQLPRKR